MLNNKHLIKILKINTSVDNFTYIQVTTERSSFNLFLYIFIIFVIYSYFWFINHFLVIFVDFSKSNHLIFFKILLSCANYNTFIFFIQKIKKHSSLYKP